MGRCFNGSSGHCLLPALTARCSRRRTCDNEGGDKQRVHIVSVSCKLQLLQPMTLPQVRRTRWRQTTSYSKKSYRYSNIQCPAKTFSPIYNVRRFESYRT